jgi:hypothetical protein
MKSRQKRFCSSNALPVVWRGMALVGGFLLLSFATAAVAEDPDPIKIKAGSWTAVDHYTEFKVDPGRWTSLDRYTEPAASSAEEENRPALSVMGLPSRALNLPVLPSINSHSTVTAEEGDLFEVDKNGWMSLDHFTDKAHRFPGSVRQSEAVETAAIETPSIMAQTPVAAAMKPIVAEPTRPLNLAALPGLNKGYDVRVSSTEDEEVEKFTAELTTLASHMAPAQAQAESNWQDAATVARQEATNHGKKASSEPLNVRLAGLPDSRITPIPGTAVTKPQAPEKKAPTPAKANKPECTPYTAYKKQQLAAIESDRKTLTALQAAITEMGLDKKLDFAGGATGSLGNKADNGAGKAQPNVQVLPPDAQPGKN